jgi:hypothetical protein
VFAAAPGEPVGVPRLTSTLFPRLVRPARRPFAMALVLLFGVAGLLAALRVNWPLGSFAAAGVGLLFLLYAGQTDVFRDLPRRATVLAAVLGGGAAVMWWWGAGRVLAGAYGVSTGAGLALQNEFGAYGLAVTLGGAVLMFLPAMVVRLLLMPLREALDGFVIGAFGALAVMVAGSLTHSVPQFTVGLTQGYTASRLLGDVALYGFVDPVITVALGGVAGLALWFRPGPGAGHRPRAALVICALVAVVVYAAVWTVDAADLRYETAINIGLAILAVLILRTAVQIALLGEAPDPATGDPVLCVHCERVVPDLPFCVACGAAARASSRSSRRLRREFPPIPVDG